MINQYVCLNLNDFSVGFIGGLTFMVGLYIVVRLTKIVRNRAN